MGVSESLCDLTRGICVCGICVRLSSVQVLRRVVPFLVSALCTEIC